MATKTHGAHLPKDVFVQCPVRHVHNKSIAIKDVIKLSNAQAAADKEWDKLKHLPSRDFKKVKPRSEVQRAKKERSVPFGSLMDLCHLHLEEHFQNYKERVPEGGNVEDDSGYRAVITEQGVLLRTWQEELSWNFQTPWRGW